MFNKELEESVKVSEKAKKNYIMTIHTQRSRKASRIDMDVDIAAETKNLNAYISESIGNKSMLYLGGNMYRLNNIERIDKVLDVLFPLLHKKDSLIDIAVCIQVEDDLSKLEKLINMKAYGKIIMTTDTSYRYSLNTQKSYQISQLGIYQSGESTIEVCEFKEIL